MKNHSLTFPKTRGGGKLVTAARSSIIHSAFARALGLVVLFAISMLFSLPKVSHAQCPDSLWPSPGPDYAGPITVGPVELPGTTCYVTYTYCWRPFNIGDSEGIDYVLETVTPVPGCAGCAGLAPDSIIKLTLQSFEFIQQPGLLERINIPPCSEGPCTGEWVNTYAMACYEETTDQNGDTTYVPCGPGSFCTTTCKYCSNNGTVVQCSCSSTGNYEGGCGSLPIPDYWRFGQCYNIWICGGPN